MKKEAYVWVRGLWGVSPIGQEYLEDSDTSVTLSWLSLVTSVNPSKPPYLIACLQAFKGGLRSEESHVVSVR